MCEALVLAGVGWVAGVSLCHGAVLGRAIQGQSITVVGRGARGALARRGAARLPRTLELL